MAGPDPALSLHLSPGRRGFNRESSGEQAARYLRQLVFDGRLPPGSHIPQDEVAEELGMSRIPVREALIALERQGWVRIERHRGAFVSSLDPGSVRDHYELYGLVYGFAARRALDRSPERLLADLPPVVKALPSLVADPPAFGSAVLGFHRTVVECARSPRIGVALRAMSAVVPGDFFTLVPGAIDVERKGLASILRAFRQGDGDAAADRYARMLRPVGDLVVTLFDERGLFG
jgi:DNA-binding GntR family transcriptional regulator